jgi:hypothetical protein
MSSSSDDEYNNCPICLSSVFGPAGGGCDDSDDENVGNNNSSSSSRNDQNDICATVPCGHLYHQKCFQSWQDSQKQWSGRGGCGKVKCPTCNVRTTSCIKLFVSLEGLKTRGTNDDDDVSLSSEENESVVGDEDDEKDDDDSADRTRTTDSQVSSPLQRITRIAKGYKRKYQQGQVQFQSYREETKRWTEKLKDYESQVRTLRMESDRKDQQIEEMEKGMDAVFLKQEENERLLERVSLDGQKKDRLIAHYKNQNTLLQKENAGIHAQYQKKLEDAQAKPEFQQVLEDHPKVLNENRRLKEELNKLATQIRHYNNDSNRMVRPLNAAVAAGNGSGSRNQRVNSTKEITKALKQLDAKVRNVVREGSGDGTVPLRAVESHHGNTSSSNNNHRKQHPPALSSVVVDCGRYSAMASRMIPISKGTNLAAMQNAAFAKAMLSASSSSSSSSSKGGSNNNYKRRSSSSGSRQPPLGAVAMTSLNIASQHKKRHKTNPTFRRGIFD